ncbi:MAG: DEAD/DEAH box helicase [Bradymonadaceae bacterium]|nr:DEAD/DEAH box helicase [Lujinxingiaceae bacterium]
MSKPLTLRLDDSAPANAQQQVTLSFDQGTILVSGLEAGVVLWPALVYDERVAHHRASAFHYRHVLGALLRAGYTVHDQARGYAEIALTCEARLKPFEHQSEAVEAWLAAGKRGLVVLPTGSGKSYVAQMAIEQAGRSALVVVPTLDLLDQWCGQLARVFKRPIGMLGGGYHEIEDITVSTYDSAAIHMDRLGARFGLVVFDEVHHLPGQVFRQAAESVIAPFRLGLTATLERADGKHVELTELVGELVYERTIKELSGDILADYEVRTLEIAMQPDDALRYSEARAQYRGFVDSNRISMGARGGWQRFLAATSRSPEGRAAFKAYRAQKQIALVHQNKLAVLFDILREHHDDRVIIFTNDNATVYQISERALCPSITHETKIKERRDILAKFNAGLYRALVTSKVLNEGVDVPEANVAVILAGSGSVREHVQRLGRILRRGVGKRAILYELVTADSVETFVSQRRREHDAYK